APVFCELFFAAIEAEQEMISNANPTLLSDQARSLSRLSDDIVIFSSTELFFLWRLTYGGC
ncbi:MAG TPA: hypothetical protein VKG02_02320, partial [Blastocatellia bacterium]|nr:hypothetical protein [Blastocatellia bacterium]